MAIQTYNLGTVTAYGDARAGGYKGTLAEWQALMANYAVVGQQAAQSAQTATTKASEANASADLAEIARIEAETAAASITVDDTLSIQGKAADAKKTGDEISQIKEDLHNIGVFGESPYNHGPYCTKKVDFAQYYEGRNESYDITLNQNTQYQDVIDLFDDLVSADTTHITKTALGTASGGQTIYEYAFAPYTYTGSLGSDTTLKKNPLILMDAGIHGFEKNSVYGLYFFLDDLVNNWQADPILTAIRQNVEIRVIPVSNPDGFNRDRYYNANDVNINRNFACTGWTPISGSDTNNSGAEPFDQPESKILRDWVLNNKSDLMLYLNLHTNGKYNVSAYSDVNSCMPKFAYTDDDLYFAKIAEVVRRHIQIQSVKIPQMYSTARGTYGKYQQETGSTGTMAVWLAETAKVIGMTFEMFNGVKVNGTQIIGYFSAESKKMCSEMIGNMVAQSIVEYSEG